MANDTRLQSDNQDLLIESPLHQEEAARKQRHATAWAGLLVLTLGVFVAVGNGGTGFMASVLPTKQAPAFDGTVTPVEKVPNWVALKSEEYKYSYEQLSATKLVDFPTYTPANLARNVDTLKWGNPADDAIRNQKITFSVPYMGSYHLNGKEFDGSHLAVDIKVPMNTPVRSIANGIVVKVANQSSGFGKHIVVQHKDVPSVDNPSVKTTYYSSYSHLGAVLVSEGDVVLRGQNVALSGETGFATTPHIHFQIDNDNAPWHPFWPFTYQEQAAAGLDFVGALNAGLGKDKAIANTVSPLVFVQQNLTTTAIAASSAPVVVVPPAAPAVVPAPVVAPVATPAPVTASAPISADPTFSITGAKSAYNLGEEVRLSVNLKDASGTSVNQLDGTALLLLNGDVGTLSKSSLVSSDLSNGSFALQLLAPKVGHGQISVLFRDKSVANASFDISQPVVAVAATVATNPVVSSSKPKIFADVSGGSPYYSAIDFMKQRSVFGGYEDGTFRPEQVISRVEVLKVALKAANRTMLSTAGTLSYADIDPKAWYVPYVATAMQNGIMQGYIGGNFRPMQNVTRSEFLKILLLASPVSIDPVVGSDPFSDVKKDDWYAVFAQFAKQKNLLPSAGAGSFKPNEEITRGEVAEIVYRLLLVINSGSSAYTAALGNG